MLVNQKQRTITTVKQYGRTYYCFCQQFTKQHRIIASKLGNTEKAANCDHNSKVPFTNDH